MRPVSAGSAEQHDLGAICSPAELVNSLQKAFADAQPAHSFVDDDVLDKRKRSPTEHDVSAKRNQDGTEQVFVVLEHEQRCVGIGRNFCKAFGQHMNGWIDDQHRVKACDLRRIHGARSAD